MAATRLGSAESFQGNRSTPVARVAWIAIGIFVIIIGIALSVLLLPLGYSIGIVLVIVGVVFVGYGLRRRSPGTRLMDESPGGGSK